MQHLSLDVPVRASAEQVFDAIVDWPAQGQWMLGTRVWVPDGAVGTDVGGQIVAFTGLGPLGFTDTMTITEWERPHTVDVLHTGRVVVGTGTMRVVPTADGGTVRFEWGEDLQLPLGWLGRLGWPLVRPFFLAGVRSSLRRFAALVEAGQLPQPPS